MKKILLLFVGLFYALMSLAQTSAEVLTPTNTSTSYRAPRGDFGSSRGIYYLSATEISAASIPINAILSSISYRYSVAATVATTGNMRIYLQNTSDVYYNKSSTTWTTIIGDMTLVKNESATIPVSSQAKYNFQNNFRWNGGGMYVAIEFVNSATTPDPNATSVIRTNSGTFVNEASASVVTIRYSTSANSTLPTTLGTSSSSSRPLTTFEYVAAPNNDLTTNIIYALGQKPIGVNGTEKITALVENAGSSTATNKNVTLTVSGSNTFSSTKQVTLAPGAISKVVFDDFVATNIGNNNIVVSVEADDNAANDSKSATQTANDGIISHLNLGAVTSGNLSAGSSGGNYNAMFLSKHMITGTTKVNAVNITIGNSTTLDAPSIPTKIYAVILSADGTTTLGRSDDYIIVPAQDKGAKKTFFLQTPVSLTNQEFLVGMAYEAGEQIFPIRYFSETPLRPDVSYRKAGGHSDALPLLANASGLVFIEAILETSSTLPVNITTFTTKLNNNKVALNWTVGTETNVNRYEIERSANGVDFVKVAEVAASGSSKYNALDAKPNLGINYYRLMGVDNDGTLSQFNEVRSVKISSLAEKTFTIYPNPIEGSEINVALNDYPAGKYSYKVISSLGSVMEIGHINNNGSAKNTISLKGQISKGVYILYLTNGKDVIQSKFIKN